ncbi:hypothetical protein ACO229_25445 [Promicromonospora sp. MS192]|uniref:hypothetical protein n=1 Tax=Promicromonospora sp. MS192 TaxID=3412684 RepID=UPI003C2FCB42
MRKITVLGASALLVAGLVGAPAAAFAAPIAGAPVAITGNHGNGQETCPEEGKVELDGEQTSVVVKAPDGMVITGYCVKAGADSSDAGVERVDLNPPVTEVTIEPESGKGISHYTVFYAPAPTSSETPTPTPSTPGEEPSPEPTVPTDEPTEPGTEPTDATVLPGGDASDDASTAPAGDAPEELAATGASTAIGVTLIALALVGGGVTLIVLRRKGVLGS